ncbi:putative bifunctional diguanylate cyclase/phosphodiesterase [Rhizobium sp. YIM 134829]|uniref:putative bifunctional diguanylate cyclase/phosphodiesterase n=1 Tax=Rhizobium sp. YIM 134829 TaxID=3390453 RepID=UPI00397CB827
MFKVISCIAFDHNPSMLALAVGVCALGAVLTMRLFARARRTHGGQQLNWLFLTALIGGSSVWTTHFLAMLSFQPTVAHAYQPALTIASLVVAIAFSLVGFSLAVVRPGTVLVELGGALIGLGIATMHFMGMAAFEVEGVKSWDHTLVISSVVLGVLLSAVATSRIARPVNRFCKYGGAICFILAIASMHFTAMGAVSITPDPTQAVSAGVMPDAVLFAMVLTVVLLMLALGASTYLIDLQATEQAAQRFRHLSLHDPLTGLPNRAALLETLNERLRRGSDETARLALVAFDLARLREINDAHGHAAGDHMLRSVASRLSASMQEGEFLARVGGDEFVAISSEFFMKSEARAFAARLLKEVCKPVAWEEGRLLSVEASLGVALFPADGREAEDLIGQANQALLRAKTSGRQTICFYDRSMDETRDRSRLSIDLRDALKRGEFELHYQRQNCCTTQAVTGYEVLLRWRHPTRGFVPPSDFIPIAERTGLIDALGDWVLAQACREAAAWPEPIRIAVNVAPAQLANSGFPARVAEILAATGLPGERLELEITESGIIADQNHALHLVQQLKGLGISIAMDDYGTGYSSLSTLQNFPFDKIKIDRGFIDGVTRNPQSAAIVRSTLILAESLGIPVLAEGVETQEQLAFLAEEGCAQVQGYLFGRPQPLHAFAGALLQGVVESLEAGEPSAPSTAAA